MTLNNSTRGIMEILVTQTQSHCVVVSGTREKTDCREGTRLTNNINISNPIKLRLKNLLAKTLIEKRLLFVLQLTA